MSLAVDTAPPPPPTDPATLVAAWRQRLGWLARQCWGPGQHGLSVEDLAQEGVIGLLDAGAKYDGRDGNTFATYAEHRIVGAMRDAMRKADPAPRSVREYQRKSRQAEEAASQQLGRAPERAEVAAVLEITPATYDQWQCAIRQFHTLSLDYASDPQDYGTIADDTRSHRRVATLHEWLATPDAARQAPALQALVCTAIAKLSPREQLVLRLYYEEHVPMKAIGARLGITEAGVSKMHTRLCTRLARRLAPHVGLAAEKKER